MSEITYISEELVMEGNLDSAGSSVVVAGRFKGELRAKDVLLEMFDTKKDPEKIIEEKGLKQVTDIVEIENIVEEIINENQKMVEQYLSGKDKLLGFFVGQAMKKSMGKANPKILNDILKEKLSKKNKS